MKISHLFSLMSVILLSFLWSCGGDNLNHDKINHRPDPAPVTPSEYDTSNDTRLDTKSDDEEHIEANIEIRGIWQKPNVVIKRLGDLEGKVVADIGAGPYGYFTLRIAHQTAAEKIIALDIDQNAIKFIEGAKILLAENIRNRIERVESRSDYSWKD